LYCNASKLQAHPDRHEVGRLRGSLHAGEARLDEEGLSVSEREVEPKPGIPREPGGVVAGHHEGARLEVELADPEPGITEVAADRNRLRECNTAVGDADASQRECGHVRAERHPILAIDG